MQPSQFSYLVNYLNMFFPVRKLFLYGEIREFERHSRHLRLYIRNLLRARKLSLQTTGSETNSLAETDKTANYPNVNPTDVLQGLLQHAEPGWDEDQMVEHVSGVDLSYEDCL